LDQSEGSDDGGNGGDGELHIDGRLIGELKSLEVEDEREKLLSVDEDVNVVVVVVVVVVDDALNLDD
jgi:hypothetical protein